MNKEWIAETGYDNVCNPASGACRQGPNFVGSKGGRKKKSEKKKREMKKERKKFYQEQKYKLITKKGFVEV